MNKYNIFIKLLVLLQVTIYFVQSKFNKQLALDTSQRGSLDANQYHFYKVRLLKKQDLQDLIFIVEAVHPTSKPELFISSINEFPTENDNNYDQSCISLNLSVCSVDHSEIKGDQWYYIGVTCQNDCTYTLTAEYVPENKISVGEQQTIYSREGTKDTVRTFKLNIPKELQEETQEIQIQAFVQSSKTYQNFGLFVQKGDVTPGSQNTLPIVDLWHQGKSCFLTLDEDTLEFGQTYSILLEMPPETFISLKVSNYAKVRKINLYEQVFDLIPSKELQKVYELTIDTEREKLDWDSAILDIQLIPFTGQSDLYINPDAQASQLSKNIWHSTEVIREQVMITAQERKYYNMSTKTFYITISSLQGIATTYHLLAKPYNKDMMTLNFDFPVTGDILKDEIINFKHIVTGDKDMMINIDLSHEKGNPDLFVKRCNQQKNSEICSITKEEIQQKLNSKRQNSYEDENFFLFCDHIGSKDIISFEHKADNCFKIQHSGDTKHKTTTKECAYVVAVYGNNLDSYNDSQYTLVAKHNKGHQILREAIPDRNEVYQKGFNYYSFSIPQQMEQIKRIKILATEITGNIKLVSSYDTEYPNFESPNIKKSQFQQPYINYEPSELVQINGKTFFIGVYGVTQAEYIISIALEHEDSDFNSVYHLFQDQPQKVILHDKNEKAQFTFKSQQKEDLTLWLKPMHGYYDIYLSPKKQFDLEDTYVWQASDNFITVKKTDQSYPEDGQFYGIVVPKTFNINNQENENEVDEQQQQLDIYDFQIGYHDSNSIVSLKQDEVFSDFINYNEQRNFRFRVFRDQQIQITKQISNDIQNVVKLYMSYDQNNRNPDSSKNNGSLETNEIMTITKDQINLHCQFSLISGSNNDNPCYIYLQASSKAATYYSIYIDSNQATQIREFQYLESPLPLGNIPKHFYMYTKGIELPITISEYSVNADTEIYAKLIPRKADQGVNDWNFPTKNENWEYKGDSINVYNKIIITKEQFSRSEAQCSKSQEGCILLLTVYLNSQFDDNVLLHDTFYLSIFSVAQPLQEGRMVQSHINQGEYQNYIINVGEDDTEISLIVVPLDNFVNPEIYISKGIDKLPDRQNHDWYMSHNQGKHLFFNPKNKYDSARGSYTLRVYGYRGGQYQIYYHIDKFSVTRIQQGSQNEYSLKQHQPMYLEYTHYYNKDFKVLNNILIGSIKMEITSKVTEETYQHIQGNEEERIEYQWSSVDTNHPEQLKISKTDPNFCYGFKCTYLIKLTALKNSNIITTIHVDNQQQHLVDNSVTFDILDNKYDQTIYKYNNQKGDIKVSIHIKQGKVKLYAKEGRFISTTQYDQVFEKGEEVDSIVAELSTQVDHTTQYSIYKHEPFLFLVQALEQNSQYTIQVYADDYIPTLSVGKSFYGKLQPEQEQQFKIDLNPRKEHEEKIKTPTYNLNIILHNQQFVNDNFGNDYIAEDFHPSVKVEQFYNSTEIPCVFTEDTRSSISCTFEYVEDNSMYYVILNNDKLAAKLSNFVLQYSLVINDSTMTYISPNHHFTQTTMQGMNSYYEVIPPVNSVMLLEIYQCFGEIDVTSSYNINALQNGNYDERIMSYAGYNHFISVQRVKPDPLYIKIHADRGNTIYVEDKDGKKHQNEIGKHIKSKKTQQARYQIKAKFYPIGTTIPINTFSVGFQNKLNHEIKDNILTLQFGNVFTHDQNQKIIKATKIVYYVTVTQGSKHQLQYATRCRKEKKVKQIDTLRRFLKKQSGVQDVVESSLEIDESYTFGKSVKTYKEKFVRPDTDILKPDFIRAEIDLDNLDQTLLMKDNTYFTVTAIVTAVEQHSQQLEEFKFFYDIMTITPKQLQMEEGLLDKINWNYVWIAITVYVVTFGTVVGVCYKLKKTQDQLKSQRTEIGQSLQSDVEMTNNTSYSSRNNDSYKEFSDERN